MITSMARSVGTAVILIVVFAACSSSPVGTGAGSASRSPAPAAGSPTSAATLSASSAPSIATGGAGTKPPSDVCGLASGIDIAGLTGGTVVKTDPFISDTFPQCIWELKDGVKLGTAVTTILVAFAPTVLFDNNGTAGQVAVSGIGDGAYAYPPGKSALQSSGAELWVKTHGLVMRIYSVPDDFAILQDAKKTEAWTAQSLALNEAVAKLIISKL